MRRVVSVSEEASERVLEACAAFGLLVRRERQGRAWRRNLARLRRKAAGLESRLGRGQVAALTGASGSGKSTLLRAFARSATYRGGVVLEPPVIGAHVWHRPMLDLMPGTVEQALSTLARAGLADAATLVRSPSELSEGQRWRLRLALCMHEATDTTGATLVVDEFASSLDPTTGACVAAMVARWVRATGRRLVAATGRPEIISAMAPDITWDAGTSLAGVCDEL